MARTVKVWVIGSANGKTVIAVASTKRLSREVSMTRALLRARTASTSVWGTLAAARISSREKPVMRGWPGLTVSPSSTCRFVTMPL